MERNGQYGVLFSSVFWVLQRSGDADSGRNSQLQPASSFFQDLICRLQVRFEVQSVAPVSPRVWLVFSTNFNFRFPFAVFRELLIAVYWRIP